MSMITRQGFVKKAALAPGADAFLRSMAQQSLAVSPGATSFDFA